MTWFLNFRSGQKSSRSSQSRRQRSNRKFSLETLEVRRVMAYNVMSSAVPLASDAMGTSPAPAALVASAVPAATTTADVKTKIDFDVTPDTGAIVPTQAKDLNLLHFFGGEKLTVPTVVKNYGPSTASGSVTVSIYLNTTNNVKGTPVYLGAKTVNVILADNQTQAVEVDTTIPTNLSVGTKYFIVAQVTTPLKQSTINDVRATSRQFEFIGTPNNKAPFEPDANGQILYFNFVRNTLNGNFAIQRQDASVRTNDAMSFIGYFQNNYKTPTMVGGVPTLSVGINLNNLSSNMTHLMATYVRGYYTKTYKETLSSNDATVIAMLKSQAAAGVNKQAIDDTQSQGLFNSAYAERQQVAINALSQTTFSKLNPMARIAVMDQVYGTGTVVPEIISALQAGDYVRAGFELIDSPKTTASPQSQERIEAEYQNLLFTTRTSLGGTPRPMQQ
jgi:hypothetical protein